MIRSNFFLPKVAQRMPHKLCKFSARSASYFGVHRRKTSGGWHPPPARARVKISTYIPSHKILVKIGQHKSPTQFIDTHPPSGALARTHAASPTDPPVGGHLLCEELRVARSQPLQVHVVVVERAVVVEGALSRRRVAGRHVI